MPKEAKSKAGSRVAEAADSPACKSAKPYQKRSAPSSSKDGSSSSSTSKSKPQQPNKKPRFEKPASSSGLPGASKIKASIRQTKRLLAKPNLAPGTKIEAERRLKSLEADLEVASRKQVEKSRASRYHRVKFVERQKLVRRIARCKRNLARLDSGKSAKDSDSEDAATDDDDDEGYAKQRVNESKMSKDELAKLLSTLRELLQYVVQYPADLRYVALFPNAAEGPSPPDAKEKDKSRQMAYQHLERVKKAIKDGQISAEPEVELNSKDRTLRKLVSSSSTVKAGTEPSSRKNKADKKAGKADKKRKHEESDSDDDEQDETEEGAGGVKGDDFFAQDSDDE